VTKGYLTGIIFSTCTFFSFSLTANTCLDARDSFSNYDNSVKQSEIRNLASEYYLLSYSWAPRFCNKASNKSKKAGKRNYLQCNNDSTFGYILHGLWPQGKLNGDGGYPRACLGDQPKIARQTLSAYLCMTPSVWLLQHEYEYHGTCMPSKVLQTPQGYFDTALKLHQSLKLPIKELDGSRDSFKWWYLNNDNLPDGSIKFSKKSKEWQFCFDNNFAHMSCPGNNQYMGMKPLSSGSNKSVPSKLYKGKQLVDEDKTQQVSLVNSALMGCYIKGNISKKSKNKWYFLPNHPQYSAVKINKQVGERCFDSEQQALSAGWKKSR
jgi:ribonuclease T2